MQHGESEYNRIGRLGGDSPLSENGLNYAGKLREYFEKEDLEDFRIWSSQKIRAAQTASHLKDLAGHTEFWKCLDEIDAVSFYYHLIVEESVFVGNLRRTDIRRFRVSLPETVC